MSDVEHPEVMAGLRERAAASAQVLVDDLEHPTMDERDQHHLARVRRLRDGEEVIATDGAGSWRRCAFVQGQLRPEGAIVVEPRPAVATCVAMAPVKGDRSEWAVAKLTELGCDTITALRTERAAVRWDPHQAEKVLERWRRISVEACAQSRRVWLPAIVGPTTPAALSQEPGAVLAVPGGGPLRSTQTTVMIGPEGGWSEAERSLGIAEVGLAETVLRTETAAVSAGVLLAALRAGTVAHVEGRAMSDEQGR